MRHYGRNWSKRTEEEFFYSKQRLEEANAKEGYSSIHGRFTCPMKGACLRVILLIPERRSVLFEFHGSDCWALETLEYFKSINLILGSRNLRPRGQDKTGQDRIEHRTRGTGQGTR